MLWMRAANDGDTHGIFNALLERLTPRQQQLLARRVPPPPHVDPAATRMDVFRLLRHRGDFITLAQFKTSTNTYKVSRAAASDRGGSR